MFLDPILIVRDLELIKEISIKDFESFTNHRQLVPDDVDPLWNSILFSLRGKTNKYTYNICIFLLVAIFYR